MISKRSLELVCGEGVEILRQDRLVKTLLCLSKTQTMGAAGTPLRMPLSKGEVTNT